MNLKIWFTTIFIIYSVAALSQQNQGLELRPLQIGDTLPNIRITNVYNYKKSEITSADFKRKLTIIDFWFGACPGCIKTFPKLENLQKKFSNKIQILLVNFESQEQIEQTFQKWKNKSPDYRYPKLPSIVGDTLLQKLFPHQYYPHEVWIDSNGVIKAFTSSLDVNEINIDAMLTGKPARMDIKTDNLSFDDSRHSILSQLYCSYPDKLHYYSSILNYIPGLSGGLIRQVIDSSTQTVRVSRRNMTILELFVSSLDYYDINIFESPQFDFGKRVILNISDSEKYLYKPSIKETWEEWKRKNCFTYETVMPIEQQGKIFNYMYSDLEMYFNATCNVQHEKRKCLALIRTSTADKIKTKDGKGLSFFDNRMDTTKLQLFASPLNWFIESLSTVNKNTPYIFIDDTNYPDRIDMELDKSLLGDIPRLRKELQKKYDLDLVECERQVPILVFTEKGYTCN